nr:unnamed protein product [Callosobruchus analis]
MEALISEAQRRNILWNKKNPRYKDRLFVDKEWNAVAHSTGFSKEEAKRKWRNLRDQFAKELKKVREPRSGDPTDEDGHYTGRWQYFASLQFLKGIVAPRSTEGNVLHIEASQESQTSLPDTDDIEGEQSSDASLTNVDFSSQVSVTAAYSQAIETVMFHKGLTLLMLHKRMQLPKFHEWALKMVFRKSMSSVVVHE